MCYNLTPSDVEFDKMRTSLSNPHRTLGRSPLISSSFLCSDEQLVKMIGRKKKERQTGEEGDATKT